MLPGLFNADVLDTARTGANATFTKASGQPVPTALIVAVTVLVYSLFRVLPRRVPIGTANPCPSNHRL